MKKLILLLIVVLILFAVMLTCGLTRDSRQDRASQSPPWMGLLDPISKKQNLSVGDILATPCLVNGDLISRAGQACSIHIRTSQNTNVRTLKLVMIAGHSAKIDLQTHGQAGMRIEIPVRSSAAKSPEMQIPKEGAELTAMCDDPSPDPLTGSGVSQLPDCRLRISK